MTTVDERNPNDRHKAADNDSSASHNLDPWTVSQKQPVPMVAISNLWVKYGSVQAVRGISFAIPRGEVFGFIGPNGAGKSSTIRVLATLQSPTAGWAMIDGIEVRKDPTAIRRKIGYMPDYFGLYEDLTVREYLHFFAAAYDLPEENRDRLVADVLTLTDLSQKIDTLVDHLSRGMKQRLGLARVLLHDPELLLLDEPASGLDPRARIEVREILKELSGMGKTILISSHILHELSHLCTRIGILEAGKLMTEGSLQEIYARLGLMQIVHAQVVSAPPDLATSLARINGVEAVDLRADRLSIRIRAETLPPEDLLDQIRNLGARVRMFQPEAMELETAFLKLTEGKTA
jgi:ABC-2 type transport system ATP-binding protein